MLDVGSRVGSYDLVAELGRGGMATLFLGRRTGPAGFTRHVAVKVVHHELLDDPHFVRMFLDEVRLCALIDHPNVVHVEELGEADGQHYLVMEHVDGVTLSDVLRGLAARKEPMSVERAVAIAAQVADALHGAHEATDVNGHPLGLVHRDVSPQNVLLSSKGHVKLIDFGIAKARGRVTGTQQGTVRGKLAYMAPEQASGAEVDRRTDVFALGVILWEALTLRRLFWAKSQEETLARVRAAEVEAPSSIDPRIPAALDQVVLSALAQDPARRLATAYLLRTALLRAVPEALFVEPSALAELVTRAASDPLSARRDRLRTVVDMTRVEPWSQTAGPAPSSADDDDWVPPQRPADALPGLFVELETARAGGDVAVVARALGRLGNALAYAGRLEEAEAALAECAELVARGAPGLRPRLASWRAQLAALQGDLGVRLATQRDALQLYEEAGQARRAANAAVNLADIYNRVGDHARAERLLLEAVARARQLDMDWLVAYALLNLGYARTMRGCYEDAAASIDEAHRLGVALSRSRIRIQALIYRAELWSRAGRPADAIAVAEAAAEEAEALGQSAAAIVAWSIAARAQLAVGLVAPALERSMRAMALYDQQHALEEGEGDLFVTHARALEGSGDHDGARATRARGRERLRTIADCIADPEIRRGFLSDVEAHAELMAATGR